jgi:hypothetical protein
MHQPLHKRSTLHAIQNPVSHQFSLPFAVWLQHAAQLQWNYGLLYNVLLSTDAVRPISANGISWCVMCELDQDFMGAFKAQWSHPFPCVPARDALP